MSPFHIVCRMLASVACGLLGVFVLCWFKFRHGDAGAGIAAAGGCLFIAWFIAPPQAEVNELRDLIDKINAERGHHG